MLSSDRYQYALISLGGVATLLFGVFFYRELFPPYKAYQKEYVKLEEFRSDYTHQPPPPFQYGIKQIVLQREDKGEPVIDRCTSCHTALQIPDFSPTSLARGQDGRILLDAQGHPLAIPNKEYVWNRLDEKIRELEDPKTIEELRNKGENSTAEKRLLQAEEYKKLKLHEEDGVVYNMSKALRMHPLIGKETRPFEYHNISDFGCTSCHGGNGRALTTAKAHGPVFDGHYEKEPIAHHPHFTEQDLANDPPFAKAYNGEPGEAIKFQTTPILIGPLMEAKCVQCHQTTVGKREGAGRMEPGEGVSLALNSKTIKQEQHPKENISGSFKTLSGIDFLTTHYQQGRSLFISQACYACHRIAGFSRGGIGPELTSEGKKYPWFIKESVVWPQADLAGSTMPNYQLDHEELQDLVTYLLGQVGQTKAVSETAYRAAIQEWEVGRKESWEKPISPAQIIDLRYGMAVFATEGCASCHRLQGFESDTGFAFEKQYADNPSFAELSAEKEWFRTLFPEDLKGLDLVKTVEAHSAEIDRRIVDGVRQGSILEEIEKAHPGLIEAYYTPFKYAGRAKDESFRLMSNAETGQENKEEVLRQKEDWKKRLHRILMVYVQEYGLGRVIGPKLNWSGVYRSDQWLMEHFRKPAAHIPRSIMPVFPFDETKFQALTNLLNILGTRNKHRAREQWSHRGFDPKAAYEAYCAQCHGEFLQGNGPVAAWIYPIPKNLRNGDFMLNLTKEKAIEAIAHGVKGSPMPPWGEAAGKQTADGTPVLKHEEIVMLVDWMFSFIPGSTVIAGAEDVPKWHYQTGDVAQELQKEGDCFAPGPSNPVAEDIFDVRPDPLGQPIGNGFYIKSQYYTVENIEKGKGFFVSNCTPCHGAEADGSGLRAEAMHEAKPRMLTNIHWLKMHDDLYLLRSIKYGKPGTSMTPWGDLTSSLQRLQLAVYIRSLSEENKRRDQLSTAFYKTFSEAVKIIDFARAADYRNLEELRRQHARLLEERSQLYDFGSNAVSPHEKLAELYENEKVLLSKLKLAEEADNKLQALKDRVQKEGALYQSLSEPLIVQKDPGLLENYERLLAVLQERLHLKGGQIQMTNDIEKAAEADRLGATLEVNIDRLIFAFGKEKELEQGKFPSAERHERILAIEGKTAALLQLKQIAVKVLEEAEMLRKEQWEIYKSYTESFAF